MRFNRFITSPESLVTSHEETRAGFLKIVLEKNRIGDPYIKQAFAFRAMVSDTKNADDLLMIPDVRPFLVSAAGLSDKSLSYLNEDDQKIAIKELIEKFLKPSGENYIDEAIFRYLLAKGDALGGTMRNRIGALGQERLIRAIYSIMGVRGIEADHLLRDSKRWNHTNFNLADAEKNIRAIHWKLSGRDRLLIFNTKIPTVDKNVDICLFEGEKEDYKKGSIVRCDQKAIMFGELKAGIDPAGADEHWKTGNSALNRIRAGFSAVGFPEIKTSFVGAAIELSMAKEIYNQLSTGVLSNFANLTHEAQLTEYCNWILDL